MKRILYVELSSGFGGSSAALYSCLKYLNKTKFYPLVLITHQGINFDRIRALGVPVIRVPLLMIKHDVRDNPFVSYSKALINLIFDIFFNAGRIKAVIRKEKIDLVHINTNIKNNLQTILAAQWAKVPCVCHVRETRILLKLEKNYRRFLSRIVVLNKEALAIISDGYNPQQVNLIPDGYDPGLEVLEEDIQKIKQEMSLEGKYSIGTLGRLVEGKGQDDLIRAAAIILKEHKNVKFLVIGNDPDHDHSFERKLRALAQELDLGNNLIFTGWRTDKNEIMSVLDIVVLASSTFPEGTPLSCIEAMAFKKPVVATNIPGLNYIVDNGLTGILVPPADPKSLAAAIIKIMHDPMLAQKMGEAGKKRVEKYFDIKTVVTKIENMYEAVFGEIPHV